MLLKSVEELVQHLSGVAELEGDQVQVTDAQRLPDRIDSLVYTAVFGQGLVRDTARWLIWELGRAVGIYPASIHEMYMASGRGELPQRLTVPAINVRAMNFNTSRAIFRAANKLQVGAVLFEIARSEMGYTDQRPAEYVTSLIASAIKEGFAGPLFVQGDHIQVSAKNYAADAEKELGSLRELITEAVEAGFYNIDIDSSTLVDLSFANLADQQRTNYSICAALTRFVRQIEPEGITVSLGGEIGEVGALNSTVPELRAFMNGYLDKLGPIQGISKISVQTGTSHGGVVLPDGTLAEVSVDFDTLGELSRVARESYGLGGAVQHGASTLPPGAFSKFPETGAIEIHLATNFQNIIFDHLPGEMVNDAYAYVMEKHAQNWKEGKTEEQFLYSERKRAIGPFKKAWWDMDAAKQAELGEILQGEFEFLFKMLNVINTRDFVNEVTPIVSQHRPRPTEAVDEADLEIASDLAD
jgi:fructose/tagatose bisphosphate aldolase